MNSKNKELLLIVLLCLLLSVTWVKNGLIVHSEDIHFILNPEATFFNHLDVWNENLVPGLLMPENPAALSFLSVIFLLYEMNFPRIAIQGIYFFSFLLTATVSMYFLTKKILREKSAPLIAALFYITNPYFMTAVLRRFSSSLFIFYTMAPLIILLYMKYLDKKEIKYAFLFGAVSTIQTYSTRSGALLATNFLMIGVFFLYNLRGRFKEVTLRTAILAVFWILFNSYWIIPYVTVAPARLSEVTDGRIDTSILESGKVGIELENIVRLFNYPMLLDIERSSFAGVYETTLFVMISWIIPILVFLSLIPIFISAKNKGVKVFLKNFYFPLITAIILFLSKGINEPAGQIFELLYTKVPFFILFRDSFGKLGILLPLFYSLLISKSMLLLRKYKKLTFAIIISIFIIQPFPIWTGQIFEKYRVNFPAEYIQLNKFLVEDKSDFNILHLPFPTYNGITYKWGFSGSEPSQYIFSKPSLSRFLINSQVDNVIRNIDVAVDTGNIENIARTFNVKYVVVHNDVNYSNRNMNSPEYVKEKLNSDISLEKSDNLCDCNIDSVEFLFTGNKRGAQVDGNNLTIKSGNTDAKKLLYFIRFVQNSSVDRYLLLNVNSSSTGDLIIGLRDSEKKEIFVRGNDNEYSVRKPNQFQEILVDFGKSSNPEFNKSSVSGIYLGFEKADYDGEISIEIEGIYNVTLNEVSDSSFKYVGAFGPLELYEFVDYENTKFIAYESYKPDGYIRDNFLKNQTLIVNISERLIAPQNISYEKLSPSKYIVYVENSTGPFVLYFLQTFNPKWRASVGKEIISEHTIANKFANAWLVNKTGDFSIIVEFRN